MLDFGSSLVDLAIYREGELGRRVFMDFNRNPLPVPGDQPFSLSRLDADVSDYLTTAGAVQDRPIDRLRHMNPLSIELYRRYKIDIAAEPLEFAVNNQHMNGGIAVDIWGRSSRPGIYAVGEAAGTHGVTRPGGSALNAGQVFGTRVAEHIAATGRAQPPDGAVPVAAVERAVAEINAVANPKSALKINDVKREVQARMSERAGLFCTPSGVAGALTEARALTAEIRGQGIAPGRAAELGRVVQWQQMALVSEAVLTALDFYISHGGGSRGARAICDPAGSRVPEGRSGPLDAYRFREESAGDRDEQITLSLSGDAFAVTTRPNRALDESRRAFFERDWPDWLTGAIYRGEGA